MILCCRWLGWDVKKIFALYDAEKRSGVEAMVMELAAEEELSSSLAWLNNGSLRKQTVGEIIEQIEKEMGTTDTLALRGESTDSSENTPWAEQSNT